MRILYIFPHPDDESFGPAAAMHRQLKEGHEVFLLTLTKGGATKQRFKLGLSVEEMGEVRFKEMQAVEKTLGLTGMEVWDYPDSGLKEIDPRVLEKAIADHIKKIQPAIIVSYPVHGISGFHDHLVMHAVIKRVYLDLKDRGGDYLKRLAFYTLMDNGEPVFGEHGLRLKQSEEELIDCVIAIDQGDIEALKNALACYKTYQDTIAESGVIEKIGNELYFEFFGEDFKPTVPRLEDQLKG